MISQVIDWLNENSFRAYPLKEGNNLLGGVEFPNNVILDASFVFPELVDNVRLLSFDKDTGTFLLAQGQEFVVDMDGSFPQYVRNAEGSLLVVGEAVKNCSTGYFTNCYFEDAVTYEFNTPWYGIYSLTVTNGTVTKGFSDSAALLSGVHASVRVSDDLVFLSIGPDVGDPSECEPYGEQEDDCTDFIGSINGAVADADGTLKLTAGQNVIILEDPDNHRIFVGVTFDDKTLCKTIYPRPQ